MSESTLPPKHEVFLHLLKQGICVLVHLDPRRPGVELPDHLKNQVRIALLYGLELPIPIPDLKVTDQGIQGTLSFNRSPFLCQIPWTAVFAISTEDQRGVVWEDDVPADLPPSSSSRPKLVSVPGEGDNTPKPTSPTTSKPRGHLRLVK